MKKRITISILTILFFIVEGHAQQQRYSFFVGGGAAETFHVGGAYQLYPSGRLSTSLGVVRDFNQWLLFPWRGINSKVHHTTFSLDHQYFFKDSKGKVSPFYFRTGLTYRRDQHFTYNGNTDTFNTGNSYSFLFLNLALGLSIDLPKHWGFSADLGAAPLWREGFTNDVDDARLLIAPIVRLQLYYWN
jgi:hypothetical protein